MSSVSVSMLDSVYPSVEKIRIFTGRVWNDARSTVIVFVVVTEVAETETAGDDDALEDGGNGGRKVADVERAFIARTGSRADTPHPYHINAALVDCPVCIYPDGLYIFLHFGRAIQPHGPASGHPVCRSTVYEDYCPFLNVSRAC
ncbi:hypothetical protein FOMPIDRAFT_1050759 [Fomitopsis schrenkii]|uniref:Uncharacterized protein n=1 Tax=Fomitopsis schrenkii TaxID=2126942 RepID=S8E3A5_FOMSC|nr:hypothetical protein FOMPIDRAFT_1050759 [Fomitopsis schrenkii]